MKRKTSAPMQWTLVQHSGFGYKGDPQFARAVEERLLTTDREIAKVRKAGGLVFEGYGEASDREHSENYPPEVNGLIPRVRGSFSRQHIDGLRIYIPKPEAKV